MEVRIGKKKAKKKKKKTKGQEPKKVDCSTMLVNRGSGAG
jgi:hypothetical protein